MVARPASPAKDWGAVSGASAVVDEALAEIDRIRAEACWRDEGLESGVAQGDST